MVIDSLIEYINTHSDWQESLKRPPYNLKSVKNDPAHPTHWMFVYNLFDSDFSLPEVCAARGTVLDVNPETGKVDGVVCHAFDKFFNYGDPHQAQIDWSTAHCQEKCVSGDSVVETENGLKTIEQVINDGDEYVKAYDENAKKAILAKIIGSRKKLDPSSEWYEITTESGKTLKITGNDLLKLSSGAYRKVEDLSEGDEIILDK